MNFVVGYRRFNPQLFVLALVTLLSPACKEKKSAPLPAPSLSQTALASVGSPEKVRRIVAEKRHGLSPKLLQRFIPANAVMPSASNALTEAKVTLGRMLFFEKRLSKGQQISCNTCHQLDNYGVDGETQSTGHQGRRGGRNAPTVYHAAANKSQFWDGRARNVEQQAKSPLLNDAEMAAPSEQYVVDVLRSMPEYVGAFKRAFPGAETALTFENVALAIAAFERKLSTRGRWDAFLWGEDDALSQEEAHGFELFSDTGCVTCHMGELVGGQTFETLGAIVPWPNQKDTGRGAVTQRAFDHMKFKVPGLRNVVHTGPYLHDGSVASLDEMIRLMAKHQLDKELSADQRRKIAAWLSSLSGELPTQYIKAPVLPKSTRETPAADPT